MDPERAVVVVDRDGRVTGWDATASSFFGHPSEEILGRDVALLVPEDLRAAHRRGFAAAMAGGPTRLEGVGAHLPVRCADGEVHTFPARFTVLRDADGVPAGAVATYGPGCGAAPFTLVAERPRVRRVVADLPVDDPAADAGFWTAVLGMPVAMDLGWIVNHGDGTHQVQLMSRDATAPERPAVSVEVADLATLAAVHADVVARGDAIVYPLTDESWGVRRFFVRTPGGVVVNVLAHA